MTVRRRRVTDGITADVQTTISLGRTATAEDARAFRAALKRAQQHASFDGRVRDAEAWYREVLDHTTASRPFPYASQEWYAEALLDAIALVRSSRNGPPASRDLALSTAVRVGYLAAEAVAKHEWPVVRIGVDRQRQVTAFAKAGGEATRQRYKPETLRRAVTDYRTRHPKHSVPAVAQALIATHGRPHEDADRDRAIKALAQRIRRLDRPRKK